MAVTGCQKAPTADELLSHTPSIRDQAFTRLAKLGNKKKEKLVSGMILGLRDNDPQINQRALDALVLIGAPAVPSLTTSLTDTDPFIRASVADSLGKIGAPSMPAIDPLTKALDDPHPLVREEAQIAIEKIQAK